MSKYEIWKKEDIGTRRGLPQREHYIIDEAMRSVKELSQGTRTQKVWDSKKKDPAYSKWGGGGYVDATIPDAFAIIYRSDGPSVCRGWGIGGKYYPAQDCKRCNNSGMDVNSPEEFCFSCKGASYRPKI